MKTVYIETSIPSYLTARPSNDVTTLAWQQITLEWWENARKHYELFISELVIAETSAGHREAADRRLDSIKDIVELPIGDEAGQLAAQLLIQGGMPTKAEADALHVAIAAVHQIDYLLTWNCRHINNAVTKPIIRSICTAEGYQCPEICTPLELLEWN